MVSMLSDKHIQQSIYIALKDLDWRKSKINVVVILLAVVKGRENLRTLGGSVTTFGIVKALDKICFKSKEITKSKLTTKVTDKKRKQRPTEYDILRAWRLNVSRWVIQLPVNRVDTVKNCFTKMIVFSVLSLFFISIRTCFRALMCVCSTLEWGYFASSSCGKLSRFLSKTFELDSAEAEF